MKRANPLTIETPDNDAGTALLLRLPGQHEITRLNGAAVVMWEAWKRGDFESGVAAVLKKFPNALEAQVRGDAIGIYAGLEAAACLCYRKSAKTPGATRPGGRGAYLR